MPVRLKCCSVSANSAWQCTLPPPPGLVPRHSMQLPPVGRVSAMQASPSFPPASTWISCSSPLSQGRTQNRNALPPLQQPLLSDAACCCQGLGKAGELITEAGWDAVQVGSGQSEVLSHGAIFVDDAQHDPVRPSTRVGACRGASQVAADFESMFAVPERAFEFVRGQSG